MATDWRCPQCWTEITLHRSVAAVAEYGKVACTNTGQHDRDSYVAMDPIGGNDDTA
jgi:hypothetical protein